MGLCIDVHAFLGWFDISFSCCHKPVNFSTGPQAKVSGSNRLRKILGVALLIGIVHPLEADCLLHPRDPDRLRESSTIVYGAIVVA
jgi:hypothetical protein